MNIATHRFRGFDSNENTSTGFANALSESVKYFEFDVRITVDRIPVVNHDHSTETQFKSIVNIPKSKYQEIKSIKYKHSTSPGIMTLDECLDIFMTGKKEESKIFIDIKDFGEEEKIYQMLSNRSLLNQSVIVSWLPEVLFSFHRIDPKIPLCFSHNFIQNPLKYFAQKFIYGNKPVRSLFGLLLNLFNRKLSTILLNTQFYFDDYNGLEKGEKIKSTISPDSEHTLSGPVTGRLLEIILESKGFVCINYKDIPENYKQLYQYSPALIPYSINSKSEIEKFLKKIKPDYILSDVPALVSKFE
ncbi:MAG: hypothetical protein KA747_04085 [Ignavibacteriaceae bacterium]|nr:hypothetical protein [Ignavibacteriaceae bacterium]